MPKNSFLLGFAIAIAASKSTEALTPSQAFQAQDADNNGEIYSGGVYAALAKLDPTLSEDQLKSAVAGIKEGQQVSQGQFLSIYYDLEGPTEETTTSDRIPSNCVSWYDGCNTCGVSNGKITFCTKRQCFRQGKAYCSEFATTAPSKTESIPSNCVSWFDGCNTCGVSNGRISYCTKMACLQQGKAYCRKFATTVPPKTESIPSNCVSWYDGCNTCGVSNGKTTFCTEMWCEKPGKAYCTKFAATTVSAETEGIPSNCVSWFDGCNTCGVSNGKTTSCTRMYCFSKKKPYCLKYDKPIRCAAGFCENPNDCPRCPGGMVCNIPEGMMCAGTCYGTCSNNDIITVKGRRLRHAQ